MRPTLWLTILAFLALLPVRPAAAAEERCPLDLATCLAQFEAMRERPWLGVELDMDANRRRVVTRVEPGSPARIGGIRPGDVLMSIEGKPAGDWFATKAGWGPKARGHVEVLRGTRTMVLELPYQTIPEEVFARIVGVHMVEGHLAYLHSDSATPGVKP